MITIVLALQSSYAQGQEGVFDNADSLVENNSLNLQQSSSYFVPEPILIANGNNNTHFVWEELVEGKSEIFYAKRTADGFIYKTNLSLSRSHDSIKPSLFVDNNNIYFTWWEKYDNGTMIPMFRASSDSGTTFGKTAALSNIPY